MEAFLLEKNNLKVGLVAQALNAAGNGARINMRDHDRCTIIFQVGEGVATTFSASLQQHTLESAGQSKALEIANKYFVKADAATFFTKEEPDPFTGAASTFAVAELDTAEGLLVLEVLAENLDRDNGYSWISANLAAPGAARPVAILYQTHVCKHLPPYEQAI